MSDRLPSLNGLRAFEAVARLGAFTAAADELAVTQTAVSHRIKRLEEELGVKLFARAGRAVTLTRDGVALLPRVRDAFDSLRIAAVDLRRQQSVGLLTVTTTASFASKWLIPHMGDFQRRHPDIDVRFSTSIGLVDLGREEVDIGIRYGFGDWEGVDVEHLMDEDIFPVCSPDLLADRPIREPSDLRHHTLLHVSTFPTDWRAWLTAFGVDDVDPEHGPTFDIAAHLIEAAVEGLGVALGRRALVESDLASGRLIMPLDQALPTDAGYYLVTAPGTADLPKIAAFRAWMLETVASGA